MSQLLGIIQRLMQLRDQEPSGNEAPQRNFEVNGEKKMQCHLPSEKRYIYARGI